MCPGAVRPAELPRIVGRRRVVRRSTRSQCITHGIAIGLPGRGLAGPASNQGANAGPALFAARHGRRVPAALSGDDGPADASAASPPPPPPPPLPPPLRGGG